MSRWSVFYLQFTQLHEASEIFDSLNAILAKVEIGKAASEGQVFNPLDVILVKIENLQWWAVVKVSLEDSKTHTQGQKQYPSRLAYRVANSRRKRTCRMEVAPVLPW